MIITIGDNLSLPESLRSVLIPIYKNLASGKCACGVPIDIEKLGIPRIMIGARKGADKTRLIVVGKNPGHPVEGETQLYKNAFGISEDENQRAELLFDSMLTWGEHCHTETIRGRQGIYHRNLLKFIKDSLNLKSNDECLDYVYFTELMKCSTENEQALLDETVVKQCAERWLRKELELLPPKVPILAIGREVERFLRKMSLDIDQRTVYIHHPSYTIRNYIEAKKELQRMLGEYLQFE